MFSAEFRFFPDFLFLGQKTFETGVTLRLSNKDLLFAELGKVETACFTTVVAVTLATFLHERC